MKGNNNKKGNLRGWGVDNGAKGKRCQAQSTRARVLGKDIDVPQEAWQHERICTQQGLRAMSPMQQSDGLPEQ